MISVIPFAFLLAMCQGADQYFFNANLPNVSRSTLAGVQAYRSALTLDWLAAEDQRQRDLAAAFVTQIPAPSRSISTDCISFDRPSSGKVARLMLELLKNLEGDESTVVTEMIQALVRSKMLVETSTLEVEPDLESLVKTPAVMMGEPHITFPRILAMAWMTVADPVTTKKFGWCPLQKLNKYLATTKPANIAKHMRALEPIIARARYIMEEFIQHVTPLNIYEKKSTVMIPVTPKISGEVNSPPMEGSMDVSMESMDAGEPMSIRSDMGHSRTFRRLIISTRVTRTTMTPYSYVSSHIEMSRAAPIQTMPPQVDSEPLSNLLDVEEDPAERNDSNKPIHILVLFITCVVFMF